MSRAEMNMKMVRFLRVRVHASVHEYDEWLRPMHSKPESNLKGDHG